MDNYESFFGIDVNRTKELVVLSETLYKDDRKYPIEEVLTDAAIGNCTNNLLELTNKLEKGLYIIDFKKSRAILGHPLMYYYVMVFAKIQNDPSFLLEVKPENIEDNKRILESSWINSYGSNHVTFKNGVTLAWYAPDKENK